MKNRKIIAAILVASLALVGLLTGCSQKVQEPWKDAPTDGRNDDPAEIIGMPDGFSNVATKCDGHGNRVYVAYKADANRAALAVVPDKDCPDDGN